MSYRQTHLANNEEVCVVCDTTDSIVVHHLDGDRSNNTDSNLVSICKSCHTKVHCTPNPVDQKIRGLQSELADPPTESERATPFTIRLDSEELNKLDAESEEQGFSNRTDYIRWILRNRDSLRDSLDQNTTERLDEMENRLSRLEEELELAGKYG